jgi:hypothetical protein
MGWPSTWDWSKWLVVVVLVAPVVPLAFVQKAQLVGFRVMRLWCAADIVILVLLGLWIDGALSDELSLVVCILYCGFQFFWIRQLAMRLQAFRRSKWYALFALFFFTDVGFAVMFLFARTKEELSVAK